MSDYSVTLSTTEPNNYVGLIKLRQGDVASQSIQATITANGQLFNFDHLAVFFNAVLPNGNVVRDKVTNVDYANSKLNYVVADRFLQEVTQVTAWFSFENDEKIVDSTKNFQYSVIAGWKECIPQGNYIYELSEIQREIEEIISNKDFTSLISKISSLETYIKYLDNSKVSNVDLSTKISQQNEKISNIISGTPKGTFATLAALQTAYPRGTEGVFLVLENGHWYYYASGWKDGGVYQGVGIADGTVTLPKLSSDISGLTKIQMTSGYNITTGVAVGATVSLTPQSIARWNYAIVSCVAGDQFTISGIGGVSPRAWAFVDNNNNLISKSAISATLTNSIITAPAGAAKLIINSSTIAVSYVGKPTMTSVSESINNISNGYGENLTEYAVGGNIKTGGDVGTTVDLTPRDIDDATGNIITNYICAITSCTQGDRFKVYGVGGVDARLWAFLDTDNKLLSVQIDNIGYKSNLIITAPSGSAKLITNFKTVDGNGNANPTELYLYTENNVQSNTSRITNLEQIRSVNFAKNYVLGAINTTGSIGTNINTTVQSVANYRCVTLSCTVGQKFRVHGTGGVSPKLWAFLDSSNNLVASQDSAYAYVQQDVVITVPIGATKLIVNFNVPTLQSAAQALLCEYDVTTVDNNEHAIEITENQSYNPIQTIEEDAISSFINGIHFSDELQSPLTDFKKPGDLMVHVSSFCIVDDIVYMTYYANTISAAENPAQHTARFAHCPLNDLSNKIFVDLCNIGDTINGKTVTAIYDTILLRKDDTTLYLMWTVALDGEYYRVYKTFDVASQAMSDTLINSYTVGTVTNEFSISGMSSSLDANNITYKPISGDIGIMQKLSTRVEGGTTYYYTGAYVGAFNCIIKSSDLINWIYVSQPDFVNDSQWENSVYVIGDKVFYFCRQYAYSQFGFLTFYNIVTGQWSDPVMVYDAQSRSDFFMYNDVLYLVHAPKDRNHIAIMQIDQTCLNRSRDIKVAKVPDYFYPFTQIYNGELYMSFTQTRQHIWLSKFTLNAISTDAIIDKFKQLFLP